MTTAGYHGAVPSTGLSTVLFALLALTATDRTAAASCGSDGPTAACIKAKAVAALDRASRADVLPLVGPVTLVRDASRGRQQRSTAALTEGQLRDVPDHVLDSMLYEGMAGALDGRAVHVGLPDVTADQLKTVVEEGRGKMKKTMGMMMTVAAMKAMMIIPLALGVLFLMAGKAMIVSKIALVLSLIITLKKLLSKSGEHVVHETHSASAAWPSAGSPMGYGGGGGGGWDKRSSAAAAAAAGQMMAYSSYKP